MPSRPGTSESPILPIENTSTRLIGRDDVFRRVHNMYPTEEGGLRSIDGPIPFLENYDGSTVEIPDEGTASPTGATLGVPGSGVIYGIVRGVGHAWVGDREILLVHVDEEIWDFTGWNRGFRVLVASANHSPAPLLAMNLWDPLPTDFPTQFVRTPRGIICIPSGNGRAFIYDGTHCLRLGYGRRPPPPGALGPVSSANRYFPVSSTRSTGVNDSGYAMDGRHADEATGMPSVFKYGRLGTVQSMPITQSGDPDDKANVSGFLLPGRYRAAQQWGNIFGDLSPWSFESNDITFDKQPATDWNVNSSLEHFSFVQEWTNLAAVRKQVAYTLSPGPEGTVFRNVARTRDITGKGDTNLYIVPRDATANAQAIATIPDNVTSFFPDNIPDDWLYLRTEEIEEVPPFRIGEVFAGRLFAANSYDDPGAVWPSMVGRYGTFPSRLKFYPDPEGAEITGLKRVQEGLLAFSVNSTYVITPNDQGDGFRSFTLDANVGCVAPSSLATLRDGGVTLWLGRDGFYSYDRTNGVRFAFADHRQEALLFNNGMLHKAVATFDPKSGEYRCWVPTGSSLIPNVCWCFDGRSWRTRDDVQATGVVVTNDHRSLPIVAGRAKVDDVYRYGLWVLDHGGEPQPATVESGWIHATRSSDRASFRRLKLLLRETEVTTAESDKLSVTFYRDYRRDVVADGPIYKHLYPDEGVPWRREVSTEPEYWGGSTWDASTFRTRRPFWVNVDFDVSSAEVFQFVATGTKRFEIIGFAFEEQDRKSGSAQGY